MNKAQRDKIVDDLLLRYPRGKTRKLTKANYEIDSNYDYDRSVYVSTVICGATSECWGWSKEMLFDLGLHSQNAAEKYLKKRFYEDAVTNRGGYGSKRATLTRKTRRLWGRIDSSIRAIKQEGAAGVYRISAAGYGGGGLGHIATSSKDKAENIAAVMFAHVLTEGNRRYGGNGVTAELISRANIEKAVAKNASFFKKIEDNIESQQTRIKDIEESIVKEQLKLAAMMSLQDQLIEASTSED